jgi:uncharacterized RDD family membrane protein YckC
MPFCSSCGEEIKPNSNFCSKCGSYVGDIVPTSSLEEGTAVSAKASSELADTNKVSDYSSFYASIWTRFWAILVDGIISYALFFGITLMMFQIIPTSSYDFALAFSIVIMWGYYVILEGIFGQTVGKKLLHIKVIKEDRSQCDLAASFIRNYSDLLIFCHGFI